MNKPTVKLVLQTTASTLMDSITNMLQDKLVEEQLTSKASCESEQEKEAELKHRPGAEPEKKQVKSKTRELEITEQYLKQRQQQDLREDHQGNHQVPENEGRLESLNH